LYIAPSGLSMFEFESEWTQRIRPIDAYEDSATL
jgi:hypothetical protein